MFKFFMEMSFVISEPREQEKQKETVSALGDRQNNIQEYFTQTVLLVQGETWTESAQLKIPSC